MRIPGPPGHQQHRLVLQFAQGVDHVQRVGHHHQARLVPEFGDHRRGGAATVDDDPRMLADARRGGATDSLLGGRDGLRSFTDQFLRHRHRTAVATQQQAVAFHGGEVLADGHFRGGKALGECVHADLALLGKQREDGMATLRRITFRDHLSFVSKEKCANQNLSGASRQ
ncbi:Uncharacterised protein [Acinetobacter baumannii]|nr:Uncharacterised protein [Acinetobacter baumannii]